MPSLIAGGEANSPSDPEAANQAAHQVAAVVTKEEPVADGAEDIKDGGAAGGGANNNENSAMSFLSSSNSDSDDFNDANKTEAADPNSSRK